MTGQSDEGHSKVVTAGMASARVEPYIAPMRPPEDGNSPTAAMDELVQSVAFRAGISLTQAADAVSAMLVFLAARLPSQVSGRIHELLRAAPAAPEGDLP
jgi:hypothetical protein